MPKGMCSPSTLVSVKKLVLELEADSTSFITLRVKPDRRQSRGQCRWHVNGAEPHNRQRPEMRIRLRLADRHTISPDRKVRRYLATASKMTALCYEAR